MTEQQQVEARLDGAVVHVIDDDPAVRDSVEFLLKSLRVESRTYPTAEDFLAGLDGTSRGCILLDVRMPGMSGIQLQRLLADRHIRMPVIVLTGHADVPMAVTAMKNGAFDFLEKPCSEQILLDRIQEALASERSRALDEAIERETRERQQTLTPRESQVFELVVAGFLNKQIAGMLEVSIKTVEVHRARVMDKMKAQTLPDLVRMAMILGID
ncbi:MAG: response regulator transcription factor [Planctomycetes bacterium]|nr:response regulator transcription factor [Planctomycetota bacterium]